ncbi:MAG: DUF371 domain-containing protein [Candidatus Heimdallarchaeota archaeon]
MKRHEFDSADTNSFQKAFVHQETINARGHENILGTHASTIEITRASAISRRADCVIGVRATKGLVDFSPTFKKLARSSTTKIVITFEAGGERDTVHAWGGPGLTFSHKRDMVIRKSDFICPRTLAIYANKAALDLNRALIQQLQAKKAQLHIKIVARRTE